MINKLEGAKIHQNFAPIKKALPVCITHVKQNVNEHPINGVN